jgi:hypothetical protein
MHPTAPIPSPSRHLAGRALCLAVALTLVAAPALADVYKWLDSQGRIHYTDRPPPADAKLLSVEAGGGTHSQRTAPTPTPPPAPAAQPAPAAPPPLPPQSAADAARTRKTVDADVAGARAEQCKTAQEHYQKYVTSRRIYREGPNQERIYLSDAEADAERVNARREVDEVCGGAPAAQ